MAISLSGKLTRLQLEAVRKAVFVARQIPGAAKEIGDDLLLEADRVLADLAREGLCSHCGERPARSKKTGWCARCDTYYRTYGRLPSEETLIRSNRRQSEGKRRPPDRRPRTGPRK